MRIFRSLPRKVDTKIKGLTDQSQAEQMGVSVEVMAASGELIAGDKFGPSDAQGELG